MLSLTACQSEAPESTVPTGYPSDEVQFIMVMYDDEIYYYMATGRDEELPDDYTYAGEVKEVNNKEEPSENFVGCHLEAGQKIYANEEKPEIIYVEYETGYAQFSVSR